MYKCTEYIRRWSQQPLHNNSEQQQQQQSYHHNAATAIAAAIATTLANRCLDSSNTKYRSSTYTCSNPCIEREKGKRVSRSIGHSVLFYFLLPEVGRERKRTRVKNSVEKKKKAHPPYLIHRFVLFFSFRSSSIKKGTACREGTDSFQIVFWFKWGNTFEILFE